MKHISIIPDYRQSLNVEHKLSDILLLTICAVISGAEGQENIQDFDNAHINFLKLYSDFEHGIPAHDTIARVVACISPVKFHECFITWMYDHHSSDDSDVIAINGKTLRRSYDKSRRQGAIHVMAEKKDEKSSNGQRVPRISPYGARVFVILPWVHLTSNPIYCRCPKKATDITEYNDFIYLIPNP